VTTKKPARKQLNLYFAMRILDPFTGLGADDDASEHLYRTVDPNDEAAVRGLIREHLVPFYESWTDRAKEQGKLGLAYGLSFQRNSLERWFYSRLPPIDAPEDPARFYEWLWSELFGEESWRLEDQNAYVMDPDVHAPNLAVARREPPS
jgi:hypothetical protein